MGAEYEEVFHCKIEKLLPLLGVASLAELGIHVVLIEFSQGMDQFMHSGNPKGELIFMFANSDQNREIEKTVFERVINHEVCHFYMQNKLKLSVSQKLNGPFTFLESNAASLAEDIQLEKIIVEKGLMPVLRDEIKRTETFFDKAQVPPRNFWKNLPDYAKVHSTISVTWTYAEESWLLQVLKEDELKLAVRRNLALVQPHYSIHGDGKIKEAILEAFNEKIAETAEDAQMMHEKLVKVFNSFANIHNLNFS